MPNFWAFFALLLFLKLNSIYCQNEYIDTSIVGSPSILESLDPQEDLDLLKAVNEEQIELPEEVRRAFSEDEAVTDSVKLIDVNAPEEQKEPPRRKQANPEQQQKGLERKF